MLHVFAVFVFTILAMDTRRVLAPGQARQAHATVAVPFGDEATAGDALGRAIRAPLPVRRGSTAFASPDVRRVDATAAPGCSADNSIGIVALDHFFEYLGGIGLAVRHLDGKTPSLYFSDLANTRDFKTQTVAEAVSQELRSRMFHPRYIQELMKQRYSGATKMVDSLNNFWGWNVMDRSSVRADQWQEFYEVYIKDKYNLGLKEYFQKNHPAALAQLSERMLEAVRKGYWDAPEEVVKTLVETHEEIAKTHDLHMSNEKAAAFIAAKAAGFGLAAAMPAPSQPGAETAAAGAAPSQQVTGMKLEKQATNDNSPDTPQWRLYAAAFGAFGAGVAFELALGMMRRRA